MLGNLSVAALVILGLNLLAVSDILGNTAGKRELGELERVGTVAGGLTRRDELVGGGHRVVDDGCELHKHILLHGIHLGPVLDVRAIAELCGSIVLAIAIIDTALVDSVVVLVRLIVIGVVDIGGGSDNTAVGCRSGYRTGVHEGYERKLTLAGLGTLTVGEVTGGVADGETVVGGNVTCAKARSAEGGLDGDTGLDEGVGHMVAGRSEIDRCGLRVNGHGEVVVADSLALEDRSGLAEVVIGTAGATCDESLVCADLSVLDLVLKIHGHLVAETLAGVLLDLAENLGRIGLELMDGIGVGRMERKSDHALLSGEVDLDHAVVVCDLAGLEFFVGVGAAVHLVVFLDFLVGDPDGAEAGGLGCHHVDSVTEVGGQLGHSGACELEDLVLDEAALEDGLHERDRDIMRTYTMARLALKPYEDHFRGIDVPRIAEKLLNELAAAFANSHVSEGTVTGVAVRAEDHVAAFGQSLSCELMDHGLIGGNIDSAIFLGCGQTEHVVVLVDCAADCAERVVAVGHGVRDGELLQSAGAGRLDDAYISNVMRHHGIESDAHFLPLSAVHIVGTQDSVGDSVFAGLIRRWHSGGIVNDCLAIQKIDTVWNQFYHNSKKELINC